MRQTADADRPTPDPEDRPAGVRVLCVDDNRDLAESNAELLRLAGCEVRVCYDGATALPAAEGFRPDVCVLDLNMPGMRGEYLAVWLRARAAGRVPALIALTGDVQRTQAAGFDLHLVKPVDPQLLIKAVMRLGGQRLAEAKHIA